ncbi:MAG: MaoC family dehydratase [Salaquimonas sp.]
MPDFMTAGWEVEIGAHTFTSEEIIKFAKAYDPQIFHLDAEAAKDSLFGGLCASGWHTASIWMRKQRDHSKKATSERVKNGLPIAEFGPSPGFNNLKWMRPVFAGDTVTYFNEILSCRPSQSKPGWYVMTARQSGKNQHGQPVISFESMVLLKYPA